MQDYAYRSDISSVPVTTTRLKLIFVFLQVPPSRMVFIESPIVRMKGRKNEVEIEGMKAANKRDSVALCEFLAFMEEEVRRLCGTCAYNGGTFPSYHYSGL